MIQSITTNSGVNTPAIVSAATALSSTKLTYHVIARE